MTQEQCYLRQQRLRYERGADTGLYVHSASPFQKIQTIQPTVKPQGNVETTRFSHLVYDAHGNELRRHDDRVPVSPYRCAAVVVPAFYEYITLGHNVLSENDTELLTWPDFPDKDPQEIIKMENDLRIAYKMPNASQRLMKRPLRNMLAEFVHFYDASANAILSDLGIRWEDVLYWHLAQDSDIKRINELQTMPNSRRFESILLKRKPYWVDAFDKEVPKWTSLVQSLPEPTARAIRLAALVSASFLKHYARPIWFLARQSAPVNRETERRLQRPTGTVLFEFRRLACSVCFLLV